RAAEVTAEYDFAPAYGATINHASQARTVQTALIDLLGEDALETTGIPFMGAEDFSYYLKEVPGAYALIGAGRGETSAPLHSPRFDFNDDLIALVVQLWSKVVGAPLPA